MRNKGNLVDPILWVHWGWSKYSVSQWWRWGDYNKQTLGISWSDFSWCKRPMLHLHQRRKVNIKTDRERSSYKGSKHYNCNRLCINTTSEIHCFYIDSTSPSYNLHSVKLTNYIKRLSKFSCENEEVSMFIGSFTLAGSLLYKVL